MHPRRLYLRLYLAFLGVLLAVGGWFMFTTPGNVTWGNHHSLRHLVSYGCLGLGALFVFVGMRK